jgi:hypothetical protein
MAGETILVIDSGQDIGQRMPTPLKAESYLVYTVSSQDVKPEMPELPDLRLPTSFLHP